MSGNAAFLLAAGYVVGCWLLAQGLDSIGDAIRKLAEKR